MITAVLQKYWPANIVNPLAQGKLPFPRSDALALLEILHATRDNLNVDLRQSFPAWFKPLPLEWLLSYYPTPWPAAENEFHIPSSTDPVKRRHAGPQDRSVQPGRGTGHGGVRYQCAGNTGAARMVDERPVSDEGNVWHRVRVPVGQSVSARIELLSCAAGLPR